MTKPLAQPPQTNTELAARLIEQAIRLLSTTPAMPTERPASSAPSDRPAAAPRVEALLLAMGVTRQDLRTSRNSSTVMGSKVIAARRAIVAMLAEEFGPVQIARVSGLSVSTVREYLPG